MTEDIARIEAVARCLAKQDDCFVGAADWQGETRAAYEHRAREVLLTLRRYDSGIRSGGLPPNAAKNRS